MHRMTPADNVIDDLDRDGSAAAAQLPPLRSKSLSWSKKSSRSSSNASNASDSDASQSNSESQSQSQLQSNSDDDDPDGESLVARVERTRAARQQESLLILTNKKEQQQLSEVGNQLQPNDEPVSLQDSETDYEEVVAELKNEVENHEKIWMHA